MNDRVRVAYVAGQLGIGGAEQQLYWLLDGLDRSRFSPIVISLGPRPREYWTDPIRQLNVPVYHVSRTLSRISRVMRVTRILRQTASHLVHGWVLHTNPYSALCGALAGASVRIGSMRSSVEGIPKGKVLRRLAYLGLDVLVTNSEIAARQVKQLRMTSAHTCVVPNGIDCPERISGANRGCLRTRLGVSATDLVIGSIGRIDRNKNHVMLLRVVARLTSRWRTLRLVLIGDGPLRHSVASEVERLGIRDKVLMCGEIPGGARFLPAMDICCLSSYTEGLPNLIMEAAAAGVPVVSTACGGVAEIVEEGVTGYIVDQDNDLAMAERVHQLLINTDERAMMGQAGRQKMLAHFGKKAMVTRMTRVYEETLAGYERSERFREI